MSIYSKSRRYESKLKVVYYLEETATPGIFKLEVIQPYRKRYTMEDYIELLAEIFSKRDELTHTFKYLICELPDVGTAFFDKSVETYKEIRRQCLAIEKLSKMCVNLRLMKAKGFEDSKESNLVYCESYKVLLYDVYISGSTVGLEIKKHGEIANNVRAIVAAINPYSNLFDILKLKRRKISKINFKYKGIILEVDTSKLDDKMVAKVIKTLCRIRSVAESNSEKMQNIVWYFEKIQRCYNPIQIEVHEKTFSKNPKINEIGLLKFSNKTLFLGFSDNVSLKYVFTSVNNIFNSQKYRQKCKEKYNTKKEFYYIVALYCEKPIYIPYHLASYDKIAMQYENISYIEAMKLKNS